MLLSDEDRVEPSAMKDFLDFLDACPATIGAISCSIFDLESNRYLSRPNRLSEVNLNLGAVSALPIVPNYMSGLVFSVSRLSKLNLAELYEDSMGNAYAHLATTRLLLIDGYLRIFRPYFVLKGADIKEGGDAYSHRTLQGSNIEGGFDLNPQIYGAKARVRQFFRWENSLSNLKGHMGFSALILAKLNAFVFFGFAATNAGAVTRSTKNLLLGDEVSVAQFEAKLANEYSESMVAYLFFISLKMPPPIRRIFFKLIGGVVFSLNSIGVVILLLVSRCI